MQNGQARSSTPCACRSTNTDRRGAIVRHRSGIICLLLALVLGACESACYYKQAAVGQMALLNSRQPIDTVIENPETAPEVKQKLQLVLDLRQFAELKLLLPVNKNYLTYADLGRPYVVWVVYAAPEFSLTPRTWHYPIIGSSNYRGYFKEPEARRYAQTLVAEGFDVYVSGVSAYSSLGWFNDPILNTFVDRSNASLAALMFHELAHQRLYVASDPTFNESFASTVEQEGLRRWLLEQNDMDAYRKYLVQRDRRRQFIDLISTCRGQLETLYSSDLGPEHKRTAKAKAFEQMRAAYKSLTSEWGGYRGYDGWFQEPLNNAKLISVATYNDFVPAFLELLRQSDNDLNDFYARCRQLAQKPIEERHRELKDLMQPETRG